MKVGDTKKKKTFFCDIDGTLIVYRKFGNYHEPPEATPGAVEKITEWRNEGHMIVLTTARPEEMRYHTVKELAELNIPWDRLVMGIERGPRILINDESPAAPGSRAIAFSIKRNSGLRNIDPA